MRDFLIGTAIVLGLTVVILITWNATAYRDVDYLQKAAPAYVEECGFTITATEGFIGGYVHGGGVWYQARDTSGYLYEFAVKEWRGEMHMYSIHCLNAVSNQ